MLNTKIKRLYLYCSHSIMRVWEFEYQPRGEGTSIKLKQNTPKGMSFIQCPFVDLFRTALIPKIRKMYYSNPCLSSNISFSVNWCSIAPTLSMTCCGVFAPGIAVETAG